MMILTARETVLTIKDEISYNDKGLTSFRRILANRLSRSIGNATYMVIYAKTGVNTQLFYLDWEVDYAHQKL